MNNNMNIIIPRVAIDAFPILPGASYIRRFASLVPLSPDTVFDILMLETGESFALVTTDYADPKDQSRELKSISGEYEFEFVKLIRPYVDSATIDVREHDDVEDGFFIRDNTSYYYYVAITRYNS